MRHFALARAERRKQSPKAPQTNNTSLSDSSLSASFNVDKGNRSPR